MQISCEIENIALVGGPCSGKTSVFEALQRAILTDNAEACLSFVEEAATRLLPRDPTLSRRDPLRFQYEVSLFQYIAEDRGMNRLLACPEPLKIQITDRGVADAYIYLNEEQAREMTHQTPEEMVNRYTTVLYFEPYKSDHLTDGNQFRVEHEDEMDALERKTRDIWSRHPHLHYIPTFPTVEERVLYTMDLLNTLLGRAVFDRQHSTIADLSLL
jgi:hypothetical protein